MFSKLLEKLSQIKRKLKMKNLIFNKINDDICEYIIDNKDKFDKYFYKFALNYPYCLQYPHYKWHQNKCECCKQAIGEPQRFNWEDGYRPEISEILIDLGIVTQLLTIKNIHDYIFDDGEYINFIKDWQEYCEHEETNKNEN